VTVKEPLTSVELLDFAVPTNVSDISYSKFYDTALSGTEAIAYTTTVGTLTFQAIDETTPEVLTGSESVTLGSSIQRIIPIKTQRSYATIGLRITRDVYDTITLSQVEHYAEDTPSTLMLENGYVTNFVLPASVFKNTTSLEIKATAQTPDGKILIGCFYPTETAFILWDALLKQVEWVSYASVTCPVTFSKVFAHANVIEGRFYFLSGEDLYALNLKTGDVFVHQSSVISGVVVNTRQYYSQSLKSVITTRDGKQVKLSTGVVVPNTVSISSIISVILEKALIQREYVNQFVELAEGNTKVLVYQIEAPLEVRIKRNNKRPLAPRLKKKPTLAKIKKMTSIYQQFKYKEAKVFDSSKLSTKQIVKDILKDIKSSHD
jgi:hypothetical protein